ncbi:cytochrome c oxidase subunit 2A [Aquibacillus rhizosphaerae]|uniref:Cytochrome c oxidase subunit 2A n=1 Tax=Aquibacillus rhizosphaerae TaxID=3051431 RepID=A0ABT7L4S2_9BACI|nr:cytochrome c oxidase subunit 2A [Aquibacillus sp. LR5S19]MDL4840853.1 cytochrome c oxidase subunit 2A [Aquibacillus sp. LR5S19]
MSKSKHKTNDVETFSEKEPELKGTLIAVFGLGAFIVISWIIVYVLFVSR